MARGDALLLVAAFLLIVLWPVRKPLVSMIGYAIAGVFFGFLAGVLVLLAIAVEWCGHPFNPDKAKR